MRRRAGIAVIATAAVVALLLTACGSGSSGSKRPTTTARLAIVQPTSAEVTGADITLQMSLTGATVVPPTQTTGLRGDQGHIHVSLDGKLISMAYGLTQPVTGLTPGTHTIQAEFVASDHLPFANRVTAAVVFQAKS
jgi:hypothetical protein